MTSLITLPNSTTFFVSQNKTFQEWLSSVKYHRELFMSNSASTWLIYEDNAYEFSVLFFALLTANKSIVLPQNGTETQLNTCLSQVEGYCGSRQLNSRNIVAFNNHGFIENDEQLNISLASEITLYTSGSSGDAKAIFKHFSHLLYEVQELEKTFGNDLVNSCFVSTVSHQHIYGMLFKLLWPILTGKNVVLQPYEYPEHLCHDIEKYQLNKVVLISSPAHFHRVVKDNVYTDFSDKFSSMFSSGGPLDGRACEQLREELKKAPYEIFGSTETGGIAWRQRVDSESQEWKVFNNITVDQEADTQRLKIKSPYVAGNSWYLCDDRINLITNETFELSGRVDRIVKIEEKRVSLDHVQHCLKSLDFIDDAFCLTANNKRGTQIVAVIMLTPDAKAELANSRNLVLNRRIITLLHKDLEAIAIPKRFRYLDALPYNSSGKLNKKEMEKYFE